MSVERCPHCGHAMSKHNSLGYCLVAYRRRDGEYDGTVNSPLVECFQRCSWTAQDLQDRGSSDAG